MGQSEFRNLWGYIGNLTNGCQSQISKRVKRKISIVDKRLTK